MGWLSVSEEAEKLVLLYENTMKGLSYAEAVKASGMNIHHGQAKRLLTDPAYMGCDGLPQLVPEELFKQVGRILEERAAAFRMTHAKNFESRRKRKERSRTWNYAMEKAELEFEDPKLQAEYVWSLIRRK